jgi:copper homeostasis protein
VEEAIAAASAGVDRVELCAGLPIGGVTPSIGMIEEARARVTIPIVAMVRPREGRADPHEADYRAAARDVRHCLRAGADQVVCGVLDDLGRVDRDRNRALVEAAEGRPVCFHRVFDMARDLDEALEAVIEIGFARILTSGGSEDVDRGIAGLARLVKRSGGRVAILAGGGLRAHNARRVVEEAGCRELHFSIRRHTTALGYGGVDDTEPDAERVSAIRRAIA